MVDMQQIGTAADHGHKTERHEVVDNPAHVAHFTAHYSTIRSSKEGKATIPGGLKNAVLLFVAVSAVQ